MAEAGAAPIAESVLIATGFTGTRNFCHFHVFKFTISSTGKSCDGSQTYQSAFNTLIPFSSALAFKPATNSMSSSLNIHHTCCTALDLPVQRSLVRNRPGRSNPQRQSSSRR